VAPPAGGCGVVYFPSCLTRIVGAQPGEDILPPARAMDEVLRWAGFSVRLPEGIDGLCCGMAFASKGYPEAARAAARKTAEALWRASSGGRLPVVTDASPCAGTLADLVTAILKEARREVRMLDFPSFWAREVLPGVGDPPRRQGTAILHPTCTLIKSGGVADLLAVARAHAERVEVPLFAECCGFAGSRTSCRADRKATGRGGRAAASWRQRRLLLHLPDLRDRDVARGGPTLPLAPAPGARGRGACLTGSSTRSRRCRSSRRTSR
jgi:D-lactate dehydrogenase